MKKFLKTAALLAPLLAGFAGFAPVAAHAGPTLDAIKQRGNIKIGVGNVAGFFAPDSAGKWQGFWVDLGRALAVALFNDPEKAVFTASSPQQRLPALQSGEYDILMSGVTQTISRATQLGFHFGPVMFYDGQGLMVPKKLNVSKGSQLDGATVCIQSGTTSELNITDFFRSQKISFKPVVIEDTKEILSAFQQGRCDVITQDASGLGLYRATFTNPQDYTILPERLSKEPLAPAIRYGDDQWQEIVNWTMYALIQADEWGMTRDNVDTFLTSTDPAQRRFLGVDPGVGDAIKLDQKWVYNVIKSVGNYTEVFDRNIGPSTKIGFDHGYNQVWGKGGLLYAPPFR